MAWGCTPLGCTLVIERESLADQVASPNVQLSSGLIATRPRVTGRRRSVRSECLDKMILFGEAVAPPGSVELLRAFQYRTQLPGQGQRDPVPGNQR
jgi:hypothetical protein